MKPAIVIHRRSIPPDDDVHLETRVLEAKLDNESVPPHICVTLGPDMIALSVEDFDWLREAMSDLVYEIRKPETPDA